MQRILIADSVAAFADGLSKQLKREYIVKTCCDGRDFLRLFNEIDPDILAVDLALPNCDVLGAIHSIRTSGRNVQIVVLSVNTSITTQQILAGLGITYLFARPCSVESVLCLLRNLASGMPDLSQWCVETEIDNTLLRLGFQCGRSRYYCTYQAVMLKCYNRGGDSAKYLYAEVRKYCCKSSVESVEKAIRDAISHAWQHGDREIWKLYFPNCDITGCPANEVFIDRIARALQNRERLRKPIKRNVG